MRFVRSALAVFIAAAAVAQQTPPPPPPALPLTLKSATGNVRVEGLATLEFPWGLAFLPDGRLLITEKPGRLRIWSNGKLSEPLGGTPRVAYRGQGGLLGVTVDPAFATNRYIYLFYVEAAEQQSPDLMDTPEARFGGNRPQDHVVKGGAIARAKLEGNELTGLTVIWRQVPKTVGRGHFGGRMIFAQDGKMLVTGGDRMRFEPAQDRMSNIGKTMRINPDGSIPPDNPFKGTEGTREDIFSIGHRNVLAGAINPATNDLWVVEMGPLGGDELNVVTAGKNYGWPVVSDGDNYDNSPIPDSAAKKEFEKPVRSWTPVISPSGMIFYSGNLFTGWRGDAFIGGLSSKTLVRLTLDRNEIVNEERLRIGRRIRDVAQAPDGSIYLIEDAKEGALMRLSPAR